MFGVCVNVCVCVSVLRSEDVWTVEHPCARSVEMEMKEDFQGLNVTSNVRHTQRKSYNLFTLKG